MGLNSKFERTAFEDGTTAHKKIIAKTASPADKLVDTRLVLVREHSDRDMLEAAPDTIFAKEVPQHIHDGYHVLVWLSI